MKKISQVLKDERLKNKLTTEEVEKKTKIKSVYLRAIEEGEFNRLPSKSYAMGFVKNYAKFLGIPEEKSIPLFRREYELGQKEEFMPRYRKNQEKIGKRKFFNFKIAVLSGAVLLVIGFLMFQLSAFFVGPKLDIQTPQPGQEIEGNIVSVEGTTNPAATVSVNGEEAYVGLDGKFNKSIHAFEGEREVTITAKNRFNNETSEVISIIVKGE